MWRYMETSVFRLSQNTSRHRDLYGFPSSRGACTRSGSWRCPYFAECWRGVTDDMIRSLVISQQQMGTREIVVLHHTDCGAQTFENEGFRQHLKKELGVDVGDRDFFRFKILRRVSARIWSF